ncbi:hypothetical protein LTR85_007665 [Meristemomyces frigidus]|nr:hypothetical protein LTR85_007665 [Meristemomyces frigidus]
MSHASSPLGPGPGPGQYNEDELVALVTNIYEVLTRLGHYEEGKVHFAPAGGFAINVSLVTAGNFGSIHPRVLSLMKRLPQAPSDKAIGVAMKPVNYGRPYELARSRDIDKVMFSHSQSRRREGFARATVILIADGQDDKYPQLVLDIADSTIREVGDELDDNANSQEVDRQDHYLNWPKEDAKSYLEHMLQKYYSADWVPDYVGGIMPTYDEGISQAAEIKRMLLEDYGWPGAEFRREAWLRDAPDMLGAAHGGD